MFKAYEKYLETLSGHLNKFFAAQKPYIFCKPGCSKCCEKGIYPFTRLEFEYINEEIQALSDEKRNALFQRIKKIKESKPKNGEKFYYTCPFLVDNKCETYQHRAIECRCYGLTRFHVTESLKHYTMPACVDDGLNYSNVFDFEKNNFSAQKVEKVNKDVGGQFEPESYNLDLTFLTTCSMAEGLDFGETKALIDWFD